MCICVGGAVVEVQHHSHDPSSSPRRCPDTCPYTHALSLTRIPSPLIAHIVPTFVLTRMSSPSHTCPRPQTHALDLALTHMSSPSHACPRPRTHALTLARMPSLRITHIPSTSPSTSPLHACPRPRSHTHTLTPDHPHTFALTHMPSTSSSHTCPRLHTHVLTLTRMPSPQITYPHVQAQTHSWVQDHSPCPRASPYPNIMIIINNVYCN